MRWERLFDPIAVVAEGGVRPVGQPTQVLADPLGRTLPWGDGDPAQIHGE
jgi:hypothetical protein